MKRCLLLLVLLCLPLPGQAGELVLEGEFRQGGLLLGQVPPGSEVQFEGRALRVSEEGRFLLGFGRDFGPTARLELRYPDGSQERRDLAIAARDYDIQKIEGLPPQTVNPPEEVWARIKRENAEIARVRATDRPETDFLSGFQWPVLGEISGVYGSQRVLNGAPKRPHYGLDIAAPVGTAIMAPAAGLVTLAEDDLYYTGGTVILDHGHGLSSAFLHMEEVLVEVGQRLEVGQALGTLGARGRVTGPHLDWRINWFKQRLDPALLVPPMPAAEVGRRSATRGETAP